MLVGMQIGAATLENNMEVPQKTKIELPYDPAIALLVLYSRDPKILIQRGSCTPNVYSSTINNSQNIERSQMSID